MRGICPQNISMASPSDSSCPRINDWYDDITWKVEKRQRTQIGSTLSYEKNMLQVDKKRKEKYAEAPKFLYESSLLNWGCIRNFLSSLCEHRDLVRRRYEQRVVARISQFLPDDEHYRREIVSLPRSRRGKKSMRSSICLQPETKKFFSPRPTALSNNKKGEGKKRRPSMAMTFFSLFLFFDASIGKHFRDLSNHVLDPLHALLHLSIASQSDLLA